MRVCFDTEFGFSSKESLKTVLWGCLQVTAVFTLSWLCGLKCNLTGFQHGALARCPTQDIKKIITGHCRSFLSITIWHQDFGSHSMSWFITQESTYSLIQRWRMSINTDPDTNRSRRVIFWLQEHLKERLSSEESISYPVVLKAQSDYCRPKGSSRVHAGSCVGDLKKARH